MANALAEAIDRLAEETAANRSVSEAHVAELRRARFRQEAAEPRPAQTRDLARMNITTFAKAVPGFWQQFQQIPPEFWTEDRRVAVVACPCGQEPRVGFASIVECECERFYAWTGRNVHVANSPKGRDAAAHAD